MKGMIFKKAFLLGGIFLLATFMLVQLSWGCDDDKDKWDCDHHDKWRCDHHAKPCHPTKIQRVFLDYESDSITFIILGKNFDKGALPVVTLGGIFDLTVDDALTDDNVITATLSSIAGKNFEFGDYKLVVSTCHASACKEDKYCKDHGPNCKCKYCKDHCSKCKDKYCKDNEYKCRCKDRYSLTIPGPSGTIEFKLVSEELTTVNEAFVEGVKYCDPDYGAIGGGFSCPGCSSIIVSEPVVVQNENKAIGWHVRGIHDGSKPPLRIFVICAPVR